MGEQIQAIALTSLCIAFGTFFICFAMKSRTFFRKQEWENWQSGRAIVLSLLLGMLYRVGGAPFARITLAAFGILCICAGIWCGSALW